MEKKYLHKKGFTLIEIMVSLSIFLVIMTLSIGSITAVLNANRKSQNKKVVMDNMNYLFESMGRLVRFGTVYHCGGGDISTPRDCANGESSFSFLSADGNRITFSRAGDGSITRTVNGGAAQSLTSTSEIYIQSLNFRVFGSYAYGVDYLQPQVIITISGYVGNLANSRSDFNIQTTLSQRKLDI